MTINQAIEHLQAMVADDSRLGIAQVFILTCDGDGPLDARDWSRPVSRFLIDRNEGHPRILVDYA